MHSSNKRMNMMMKKKKSSSSSRRRRRRSFVIRGFLNYLKSDSYFYAPLFTISNLSSPGFGNEEAFLKNDGKSREKMMEYLKSDTYLYAPLGYTPPSDNLAFKTVISSRKGELKKVNDKEVTFSLAKRVAEEELRRDRNVHDVTPNTPELVESKRIKATKFRKSMK